MSANRALTLLLLLLTLVVVGCGDDDDGGGGPSVPAAEDPATMLPAGAPMVVQVTTDIDSDQVQSALAFANTVEPTDRDLKAELLSQLDSGDVSFDADIKPWLGESGMIAIDGYEDGSDVTGVLAVATSDEAATKAALAKGNDPGDTTATYNGVEYTVDSDGNAQGVANGFLIAASDEAHLKAAIDASQGASLADDSEYQEALDLVPEDSLGFAYINVDPLLEMLKTSGSLPPGTPDLSEIPGLQPGTTAVASLSAENDEVTFEVASTADVPDQGDGPDIADLPGGAWLAAAAALKGDQFAAGVQEGIAASGLPDAQQMLEQFGLLDFLGGLESVSLSVGGDSITSINGQITIGGSDQDAASKVLQSAAQFAQQAAAQQGIQVDINGDTATASAGPYKVELTAEDGDLKLTLGEQPDGSLGDDDAFKEAEDDLDLDDGKMAAYLDFAGLQKLLSTLPPSPDLDDAVPVIEKLGTFAVGTGKDGDATIARAILTLR